jgi:F-type H+-transporting ATPase subunit g
MSMAASRAVLRQSQFLIRRTAIRHSSSTSEAANKAKEAAAKAQEGLSKVASSAGPAIAGAASNVGNALRKVGGPTGKIIAFVDCKREPFAVICQSHGLR